MNFLETLKANGSKVGILGLGYVGIPLALRIHEVGLTVLGLDIDTRRVDQLNAGESPIKHIPHDEIKAMRGNGFEATTDFARSAECDALLICVPTPLDKTREPDLSFVTATMDMIAPHLRKGQMVSLESTTWPGTTREILLPYLENAGLTVGTDAFLVYSPEREDPGNPDFNTQTIPKVVGGHTPACLDAGTALYGAQYVVDKTVRALNEAGKSLKGAKVLALGIAYKRDVDDMRESPSVFVMERLRDWGADVHYSDPNVPVFPEMREHSFDLSSVDLTPETLAGFDAVILLTDHTDFDYDLIRPCP